jgi:hypothetical protein
MAFIKRNIIWIVSIFILTVMGITLGVNMSVKSNGFSHTPAIANNTASRALNTSFMISQQRCAIVAYSNTITCNATVVTGSGGMIILESSPDNSAWTGIDTAIASISGGVLMPTFTFHVTLKGTIPRNTWLRMRTVNTIGTPTFRAYPGLEVLFN